MVPIYDLKIQLCVPCRVLVTGCDAYTQRFLQDNYGADNVPGMKVIETTKVNMDSQNYVYIKYLLNMNFN